MKKLLIALTAATALLPASAKPNDHTSHPGYPITPVAFTSVKVSGPFWGARMEASRNVTIPLAFNKCEENKR